MGTKANTKADAVMARRRGKNDNEGLSDQERIWKTIDYYATPPWAARAAAEIARSLFPEAKTVREPACGTMNMAGPFAEYFDEVWPTDVYPHMPETPIRDFFDESLWPAEPDCDLIVTNPPFVEAGSFLRLAFKRARMGVLFLCRTVWVESGDRYDLFEGANPITQLCFFSERVPMALGPWNPDQSSATSYSLFIWKHGAEPLAPRWIPPGTRARLTHPEDARRYGRMEPLPLFPEPVGDVL